MMRKFWLCLLFMAGCEYGPPTQAAPLVNLKEVATLSDCIYVPVHVHVGYTMTLHVIRCPSSSTTIRYSCGKNCDREIVTVDGTP